MNRISTPPTNVQQHESSRVNSRVIYQSGAGFLGLVVTSMLIAGSIAHWPSRGSQMAGSNPPAVSHSVVAAPLDPQGKKTRQAYEQDQSDLLSTYGWTDRSHGKVRIPIERAMAILVQKNRRNE